MAKKSRKLKSGKGSKGMSPPMNLWPIPGTPVFVNREFLVALEIIEPEPDPSTAIYINHPSIHKLVVPLSVEEVADLLSLDLGI
jgi:hypothetical protein